MLSELLEKLKDLVGDAQMPKLTGPIAGVEPATFYVSVNGESKLVTVSNHRKFKADNLDSLIDAVNRWSIEGSVWHRHGSVVALLDDLDEGRFEYITLDLMQTREMKAVMNMVTGILWQSQGDFVTNCRTVLSNCGDRVAEVATLARKVKWKNSREANVAMAGNKESLGNSVEREVSAAAEFPESITLSVRPYVNYPATMPVQCEVLIDFDDHRFALVPAGNSIEDGIASVQKSIHSDLNSGIDSGKSYVYYGSPD